jgi:protein SCO1/2
MRTNASIVAIAIAISMIVGSAAADPLDHVPAPPPTFPADDVKIVERLGERVPLDVPLRDHTGRDVTLGELLSGELPTIVTFNYSNCPNLCSLQLGGLVAALPLVKWRLGAQFKIVTIVLDPDESLERARATRDRYTALLPQRSDAAAWVFATTRTAGDGAPIRRIADAVGFRYTFLRERAEWAHPAALIFVSPTGRVVRYVHGAQYDGPVLDESIVRAGTDEPTTAAGFMQRCLHWDPADKDRSAIGRSMLKYAAAGFVAIMLAAFGIFLLVRKPSKAESVNRS